MEKIQNKNNFQKANGLTKLTLNIKRVKKKTQKITNTNEKTK